MTGTLDLSIRYSNEQLIPHLHNEVMVESVSKAKVQTEKIHLRSSRLNYDRSGRTHRDDLK